MSYQQALKEPAIRPSNKPSPLTYSDDGQQQIQDLFLQKADITKTLGIAQVCIGSTSFVIGVAMFFAGDFNHMATFTGGGIWAGVFIFIPGILCIIAGSYPTTAFGTRIGALVMSIFSLLPSLLCLIIHGFASPLLNDGCRGRECSGTDSGRYFSLLLMILMIAALVLTVLCAIYTSRGCSSRCCNSNQAVVFETTTYTENIPISERQQTEVETSSK